MPKFYLIFIFLCATFITKAQNKQYSLELCNELLDNKEYTNCIIECEKVLFYSNSPQDQKKALFIKGNILKEQQNFVIAAEIFSQIKINSPKDSLFMHKTYELSLCNYLNGQYHEALNAIKQWEIYNTQELIQTELFTIKILCLNSLFLFKDAKNEIDSYLKSNNVQSDLIDNFNKLYKKRKLPKKRNPELAQNLSMFVPGLGQCYSSRWIEGGLSFLLNAGALSFGVYHIYYKYYFTGYVVGFTLLNKFHGGGKRRSYILAETRNKKNITSFNQNFLTLINSL